LSTRPTLLAISSELPWPLNSGGHLRTFHILRAIARRFDVRLLAAGEREDPSAVAALAEQGIAAEIVRVPSRTRFSEALKGARCALTRQPYVLYGRHTHGAVRARVEELARRIHPSVLYLDHLDACAYRFNCNCVSVVDLHNIYSLIAERWADERQGLMRAYFRREATLLKSVEKTAAMDVDLLFAVSEAERSYYQRYGASTVALIPNGVDTRAYEDLPAGRPDSALIVYIGSMSWRPNAEAAMFLARTVLPQVQQRRPEARLRIVGRHPPAELLGMNGSGGVEVTGEVASVVPHLREASVLAVPLAAGGGTRLKILEALAAGLPVVSTSVGAEGLDLVPGKDLIVCEREGFGDAVSQLLGNRAMARALAEHGRLTVQAAYDWTGIGATAARAIEQALETFPRRHQR
jgi:glycosyltransferase involved in cell wall biosynthesis